ncbi:hypothetical protein MPSEU_000506400 [Mayamaea pseudoterrestris]|nr:hypothetical protein MPSEU_000506400 [Mayamaea pseudoterrestris]
MPASSEKAVAAPDLQTDAHRKNDAKIRQNVNRGSSSLSSNGVNRHQEHNEDDNAQIFQMQNYSNYANNMAAAAATNTSNTSPKQPTPLFERLVTEEVQEIKAYARIIESQQRRLVELERVHGDLEARLESESNRRKELEKTLESREREWANRFDELSKDRDHWKGVVQVEQTKNSRLIDQVVRKDQDIHRMLQRKYDHEPIRGSTRNVRQQQPTTDRGERTAASASRSPESRLHRHHKSPHEILAASGSAEKVRLRNVKSLLNDFFGM